MSEETAPKGLFGKLASIMGQLERLPKNGRNTHFNYDFVTDADVSDTIRPLLAQNGIAVLMSADAPAQVDGKTILPIKITLVDSETGQSQTVSWYGEAADRQDKGVNKAATAAVKYWLLKTFLLSTGDPTEDADQGPIQGVPQWLTPEKITDIYWWAFHDKGMNKEQLIEAVGHVLNWRGDNRALVNQATGYLENHTL